MKRWDGKKLSVKGDREGGREGARERGRVVEMEMAKNIVIDCGE